MKDDCSNPKLVGKREKKVGEDISFGFWIEGPRKDPNP
jgi:hypothetical protein